MKFRKIVPYKLKRLIPMAMIAGMPLLSTSCEKEPPYHDTTYVWGIDNWKLETMQQNVTASADSADVRYVYLQNDGEPLLGLPTSTILKVLNQVIDVVTPENRHKVRGAGTLDNVGIGSEQDYRDSVALAQLGFKFGRVAHLK